MLTQFGRFGKKSQTVFVDQFKLSYKNNIVQHLNIKQQKFRIMRTILLLITVLISGISFGQNFPAESVDLLLNKTVKPITLEESMQRYAYKNFYAKFDTVTKKLEKYKKGHRAFPSGTSQSDYNKLVGKEFKVVKIYDQTPTLSSDAGRYFVLELQNEELGTVYYDYDSKYDFSFELEIVGGLELPEGFYCKDIETTTDKFSGETSASSNYSDGIRFIKTTKDGVSKIYMAMNQPGATLNVGKKGLILLLENGKKIERPNADIDAKVNTSGKNYVYSAFIELTKAEIELLIENPITDKRLYIYDGEIKNGAKLSEYLKCLTK